MRRGARSRGTWIFWVVIAAMWILPVAGGMVSPWFALGQLALGVGTLFGLIVAHELGHAAMGLLLGYRIFEIAIGTGFTFVDTVVGRTRYRISLIPGGGHTLLAPKGGRLLPAREVFVALAGPVVNLQTLIWAVVSDASSTIRFVVGFMSAILVLENLMPRRVASPIGVTMSDGLRAAHALDTDEAGVRQLLASRYAGESYVAHKKGDHAAAMAWSERGLAAFPGDVVLEGDVAASLIALGRYGLAAERLRGLVARDDLEPILRALFQNNLAWADLMLADPSLEPEALALSGAAFEILPTIPAVLGTRGFALILSGAVDEGIALCGDSYRRHRVPDDRASNVCAIAIGAARQGRIAAAERRLVQAIRLSADNALIDRAADELRAAREASSTRHLPRT